MIKTKLLNDILTAAKEGRLDDLALLAASGFDIDTTDIDGWTAATHAAHYDCETSLQTLIHAGANIDAADSHGWTPSMHAAIWNQGSCLRALIGAGANIDATDSQGRTASMLAARLGHDLCILALADAGANLDIMDPLGQTAAKHADIGRHAVLAAFIEARALSGRERNIFSASTPPALTHGSARL